MKRTLVLKRTSTRASPEKASANQDYNAFSNLYLSTAMRLFELGYEFECGDGKVISARWGRG